MGFIRKECDSKKSVRGKSSIAEQKKPEAFGFGFKSTSNEEVEETTA